MERPGQLRPIKSTPRRGLSVQELKQMTAMRIAQEGGGVGGSGNAMMMGSYQPPSQYPSHPMYHNGQQELHGSAYNSYNQYQQQQQKPYQPPQQKYQPLPLQHHHQHQHKVQAQPWRYETEVSRSCPRIAPPAQGQGRSVEEIKEMTRQRLLLEQQQRQLYQQQDLIPPSNQLSLSRGIGNSNDNSQYHNDNVSVDSGGSGSTNHSYSTMHSRTSARQGQGQGQQSVPPQEHMYSLPHHQQQQPQAYGGGGGGGTNVAPLRYQEQYQQQQQQQQQPHLSVQEQEKMKYFHHLREGQTQIYEGQPSQSQIQIHHPSTANSTGATSTSAAEPLYEDSAVHSQQYSLQQQQEYRAFLRARQQQKKFPVSGYGSGLEHTNGSSSSSSSTNMISAASLSSRAPHPAHISMQRVPSYPTSSLVSPLTTPPSFTTDGGLSECSGSSRLSGFTDMSNGVSGLNGTIQRNNRSRESVIDSATNSIIPVHTMYGSGEDQYAQHQQQQKTPSLPYAQRQKADFNSFLASVESERQRVTGQPPPPQQQQQQQEQQQSTNLTHDLNSGSKSTNDTDFLSAWASSKTIDGAGITGGDDNEEDDQYEFPSANDPLSVLGSGVTGPHLLLAGLEDLLRSSRPSSGICGLEGGVVDLDINSVGSPAVLPSLSIVGNGKGKGNGQQDVVSSLGEMSTPGGGASATVEVSLVPSTSPSKTYLSPLGGTTSGSNSNSANSANSKSAAAAAPPGLSRVPAAGSGSSSSSGPVSSAGTVVSGTGTTC